MIADDDPPVGCITAILAAIVVAVACWVIVLAIVAWRLGG